MTGDWPVCPPMALWALGAGLVERTDLMLSAELIALAALLPPRPILKDCSREVDGRNGKPCAFSSILRLCLWLGKCSLEVLRLLLVLLLSAGKLDSDAFRAVCCLGSWKAHGVTSLEGGGTGVRGLEPGLGGLLCSIASFIELFLFLPETTPCPNGGKEPFCIELASEFWRPSFPPGTSFSPKKPLSFFCMRSCTLILEPVDETVVALAMDGRLSSPSMGKHMPLPGAKPGDI